MLSYLGFLDLASPLEPLGLAWFSVQLPWLGSLYSASAPVKSKSVSEVVGQDMKPKGRVCLVVGGF